MCHASWNPLVPDPERGCLYLLSLHCWGLVGTGACRLRGDAGPGARTLLPRQCCSWKWCPEVTGHGAALIHRPAWPRPRGCSAHSVTFPWVPGRRAWGSRGSRRRPGSGPGGAAAARGRRGCPAIGPAPRVRWLRPSSVLHTHHPAPALHQWERGCGCSLAYAPLPWARSSRGCRTEVREGRVRRA